MSDSNDAHARQAAVGPHFLCMHGNAKTHAVRQREPVQLELTLCQAHVCMYVCNASGCRSDIRSSTVLCCLSKSGVRVQELLQPLFAHMLRPLPPISDARAHNGHLSVLQPRELATILWSLSALGMPNTTAHTLAAPLLLRMRRHVADKGLAALAAAYRPESDNEVAAAASCALLHMVAHEARARVQQGSMVPDALAEVVWVLGCRTVLCAEHPASHTDTELLQMTHDAVGSAVLALAQPLPSAAQPPRSLAAAAGWPDHGWSQRQLQSTSSCEVKSAANLNLEDTASLSHGLGGIAGSLSNLPGQVCSLTCMHCTSSQALRAIAHLQAKACVCQRR